MIRSDSSVDSPNPHDASRECAGKDRSTSSRTRRSHRRWIRQTSPKQRQPDRTLDRRHEEPSNRSQRKVDSAEQLTAVVHSDTFDDVFRVALDAARAAEKSANPARQERARLEREAAEEAFVNAANEVSKFPVEFNLELAWVTRAKRGLYPVSQAELQMKTILRNPEPLKSLAAMVKAQQDFHAKAAEVLKGIEAEIDVRLYALTTSF